MIAVVFGIGGAAVDAADIATVGDGDAKVGDLPAEFVVKDHGPLCLLATSTQLSDKTKPPDPVQEIGRSPKKHAFSVSSLLSKHGRPGRFRPNPWPHHCLGSSPLQPWVDRKSTRLTSSHQ